MNNEIWGLLKKWNCIPLSSKLEILDIDSISVHESFKAHRELKLVVGLSDLVDGRLD
jgi:hypothetical protein